MSVENKRTRRRKERKSESSALAEFIQENVEAPVVCDIGPEQTKNGCAEDERRKR